MLLSICHIVPGHKIRQLIKGLFLILLSAFYFVMYLIYCNFQVFYDFNTITAGARGAISDFATDGLYLLYSVRGIAHVIMFFLPLCLFFILSHKGKDDWSKPKYSRAKVGLASLLLYLTTYLLILGNKADRDFLLSSYNFQTGVAKFGLMTSVGLDLKNVITDKKGVVSFEIDEEIITQEDGELDKTAKIEEITESQKSIIQQEESTVQEFKEDNRFSVYCTDVKNQIDFDWENIMQKGDEQLAELDRYVQSLEASSQNSMTGLFSGKNLIFLTAEAFSAEVIDAERTPTLYRMATKGIQFTDYYQPTSAGTTGGEYANIFGMLPALGGKSMKETAGHLNWATIASRLTDKGYYGKAYHNNDYTFYDRDKTHINLGYSGGYSGYGNGLEKVLSNVWPQSDLEMIEGTLPTYIDKQPFNTYYMTVSGHSIYTYEKNAMTRKNWDKVKDLPYSDTIKAYLGAQQELENAMTYLIGQLEKAGIADDTVVVISTDHFPYGLDQDNKVNRNLSELYGYPITNDWERDHSRLIIWCGCLEKKEPIVVDTPTTSMDILPTLCNLFDVEWDSRLLPGRDVFSDRLPIAFTLGYAWKTELGTYIPGEGFQKEAAVTEIPEGYEKDIHNIVKNKIAYTKGVLRQDYFRHLFG